MSTEGPGPGPEAIVAWRKTAKMEWPELRGQSVEQARKVVEAETAEDLVRPNVVEAEHPRIGGCFGGVETLVVIEYKWTGWLPPRRVVEMVYRTAS